MTKKIKQIVSLSLAGVLLILFGTLFFMISINTADELPRILEYKRSRLSDGVTFSVYEKLPNESFTEKLAIDTELDTQTVDALGEVKPVLVNEYFFDTYGIAVDGSAITNYQITAHTPAAVISDRLAPLVDFFSVGTNDLTQYTLACDRQNAAVEQFVDTHHEAILRLIEMSAKNAHAHGAWIGICGELAADTTLTETFLRMGIDELSVSPTFVLKVRDAVRRTDLSK